MGVHLCRTCYTCICCILERIHLTHLHLHPLNTVPVDARLSDAHPRARRMLRQYAGRVGAGGQRQHDGRLRVQSPGRPPGDR